MVFGFRKRAQGPVEMTTEASPPRTESEGTPIKSETAHATGADGDVVTVDTGVDQLKKFQKTHQWDFNLDYDQIDTVNTVINNDDSEKAANFEHTLLEEDSPYFEVRSSVRNYDERMPANTIRAWFIGMVATTIVSAVNLLFSLRNPSINIAVYVIQLLAYPVGCFFARTLPNHQFNTFGLKWNLNPGPFNIKEHAVIVMMANVSLQGGVAYATDVLLAQEIMYKQKFGWGFQMLLVITTQCLGFGMAGIVRRFLIWPAAMIWPQTLANTALMYALHDHKPSDPRDTNGWSIGRYRYFLFVLLGSFTWYWFPGWIATGLSYFDWIVWIAPTNVIVNQIFGNQTGFGLIPITFDWTLMTAFVGSPLPYPLFSIVNTLIGVVIFFLIGGLGVKYTGAWSSDYLPIASTGSFDNTGKAYNVSRIVTPELTLDVAGYKAYSPLFLATFFTLCYGVSFGSLSAIVVHTIIFHGKEIVERARLARNQDADVHLKMMKKYEDTPNWWYYSLFIVLFALSLVTVLHWDTHLTWWAMIVAMLLAIVFLIPIGMIQGITNTQIGLNVLTEFIVGYMLPGKPLAMMLFKTYGYITMSQALYFLQDMKLGHYLKVPPRVTFFAQVAACLWASIVQIAVYNWAMGNIEDICDPEQPDGYTCPGATVFFTASVIWGLIGPARIFGAGAMYSALQWFWLFGAVLPIITYFAAKRWPSSPIRYLHWPIIFGGTGLIPPATTYIYLCWASIGIFFNGFIKRRFKGWWGKYNYVTSAGLDTGLYLSTIIIFFALVLPQKVNPPQWFMNPPADGNPNITNAFNNLDSNGAAIKLTVADGETFGPPPGSW
ncbi:OPT oligopeptide transporter protein-domain-containing protein [Pseudomassariella vexata]|uniref:OPT oligopeptide transporter protein-domain-containing protein n=1 Tax=Pseudomassariella vexata TaxID=1141098 RepID=A0A1Y2DH25_9PEZI|nr:OPT oligopeptide transporter protein-domain-containing protein [Pseudomassariella vexata]ORY58552.1 OPT oligopeptide transporter protein-domain-containing protein [Pseudomassariella vexata]